MPEARFDPGAFYEFNLDDGSVRARGGSRVLVLSDNVVAPLVSVAVRNGDLTAVRRLGRQLGQLVAESLQGDVPGSTPEQVLGHSSGVLSLFGWGRLSFERWGDALVTVVSHLPVLDEDHLGVAALLGGMFSELVGREVACVPVDSAGRFLVVDPTVAEQVWTWSKEGDDLPALVGRLSGGAS